MKRFLSLVVSIVMILSTFYSSGVYAQSDVTVELDGNLIEFDVNPEIIDGRTMVPLRKIFESIGAFVKWNNDTQTVSARKNSKTIILSIGSDAMELDKGKTDDAGNPIIEKINLDVPARVVNGRTLVPTRAISESFGLGVEWDEDNRKVIITSDDEDDDTWKENTTSINLTNLTFNGKGVEIKDKQITIIEGGDYTLTGTLVGGNITVSSKERVKLRLSGASVISETNPCIFVEKADKAYITISKDTQNTLVAKDSDDGAIYSKENLEIKGEGSLSVESLAGHGIKASDNLTIEEGNIAVNASADGIHINDTFKMSGGVLDINSVGDGIDCESIADISGGEINIITKGIPLETPKSNTAESPNSRRPMWEEDIEVEFEKSTKGINAEWLMRLTSCSLNISSASHSVHCADEIEINNSKLVLASDYEKGISAHGNLTINGEDTVIDISKSTEGIESKNVMTINNGFIKINATDDAINATGGKSGSMMGPGGIGTHPMQGNFGGNKGDSAVNSSATEKRNPNHQRENGQSDFRAQDRWNPAPPPFEIPSDGSFMPPPFEMPDVGSFAIPPFEIPSDGSFIPPFRFPDNDRFSRSDGAWQDFIPSDAFRPERGQWQGGMRGNAKDCLIINGGTFELFSGDDGLDSNGNLAINDGTIKASKSNGSFYGAFGIVDPDGQLIMSDKADIIFAAQSGNERNLKLTQNTILVYCEKSHEANEKISVSDTSGNELFNYTSQGTFATVLIASDKLLQGKTYVVKVGDESFDITISQQITTVGTMYSQGNRFGRGGFVR